MSLTQFYGPYPRDTLINHVSAHEGKFANPFKFVGNSGSLAAALAVPPPVVPAVYFCFSEVAGKNKGMAGCVIQDVTVAVSAVIWLKNYSQAQSGAGAVADLVPLITYLRQKLIGWRAAEGFTTLLLDAERDEFYKDGYLVVQEVYKSTYRIQVPT